MQDRSDPMKKGPQASTGRDPTLVVHAGPAPRDQAGVINPPVDRASTIVYDSVEAYMDRHKGLYDTVIYGLYGTRTTFALAEAVSALERGYATVITSSGTSAIALTLTAFASAGDHLLVVDCVYGPTRNFLADVASRFGVEVEYYPPDIGGEIARLFRPNTRLVYMETPGSQTFDMIDVPSIAAAARARGIPTAIDNTWATPLFFKPLDHGVDISIASATKYLSGHSDCLLGTMTAASEPVYRQLKDAAARWGNCASPDNCYLVHRGIRTLAARLDRHQRNAARLIDWFVEQPEVVAIRYPAHPADPGNAIWKRDFTGASGLFGVQLDGLTPAETSAFFNSMSLFQLGSSWGGFESLAVPAWPAPVRAFPNGEADGALIRIHAGLEEPEDLIADLAAAFGRVRALRREGGR
ncbi:cystathionine beta-lyase [Sphingomonas koreensis]|uniref:Cystathionine beta-lyase n=2 Tax=Sphingomonas koreensis TaxID=93064 RepID=A0AAJ4S5A1_9SPHN|nr:cystathionine beta-lyase [Sphingomonas koreensis]RSU27062.1 cystathionine beta-lyase [Sphingomonas koreensis]RSU30011.1 cystathionine beta-lyase [Sphingomonas koreensis]RSU32897.1 cystathionine beta-lyase [Sphingomonas koreensis]RSU40704.1 cystathionine beta-lyase [Sphingomonas koreensis]